MRNEKSEPCTLNYGPEVRGRGEVRRASRRAGAGILSGVAADVRRLHLNGSESWKAKSGNRFRASLPRLLQPGREGGVPPAPILPQEPSRDGVKSVPPVSGMRLSAEREEKAPFPAVVPRGCQRLSGFQAPSSSHGVALAAQGSFILQCCNVTLHGKTSRGPRDGSFWAHFDGFRRPPALAPRLHSKEPSPHTAALKLESETLKLKGTEYVYDFEKQE